MYRYCDWLGNGGVSAQLGTPMGELVG